MIIVEEEDHAAVLQGDADVRTAGPALVHVQGLMREEVAALRHTGVTAEDVTLPRLKMVATRRGTVAATPMNEQGGAVQALSNTKSMDNQFYTSGLKNHISLCVAL